MIFIIGFQVQINEDSPVFTILRKTVFSPSTFLCEVKASDLSLAAQPGQFVMVRLKEGGERIPLTIADFDRKKGTITLVVKVVGKTTEEMATYTEGDSFEDLVGPLGAPTEISPERHIVLIGGGLGVAPLYPILREFHERGSRITTIIGFRDRTEIFWEDRFKDLSHRFLLMTDDGSSGTRGTVVDG